VQFSGENSLLLLNAVFAMAILDSISRAHLVLWIKFYDDTEPGVSAELMLIWVKASAAL